MDTHLHQLRSDALTMLVLWATTQEYSADIEALLKQWAGTFQIPDAELTQRLNDATSGELQRPPDSRTGLGMPPDMHQQQQQPQHHYSSHVGGGGSHYTPPPPSGSKRPLGADDRGGGGGSSKRFKSVPAIIGDGDLPFANIGPAIGRKVMRYWPKDAARNKGDPWFTAVVTDYEEDSGAHILTYQFGTQREEKERVALALKSHNELRLTDDVMDLLEWYADPKKRRRSSAVEKSAFLRKQYQALHGGAGLPSSAARSKGGKGGKAHSNSTLSGYSL